jgi:hypothetical protein
MCNGLKSQLVAVLICSQIAIGVPRTQADPPASPPEGLAPGTPSRLERMVESYPGLTTDEAELVRRLADDMRLGRLDFPTDFLRSSEMQTVAHVFGALSNEGMDPHEQARYAELLTANQGTYLRFLDHLREQIKIDPAALPRMEKNARRSEGPHPGAGSEVPECRAVCDVAGDRGLRHRLGLQLAGRQLQDRKRRVVE